ncbi:isopentenyl phosphate kinase family protein [Candidatus Micrarchaeota archaeon]|nr:isopentenyl phosphate kinase family protein [Candidatus Micrarchaeota archaeon]
MRVIKIGGSVLTDKSKIRKLNQKNLAGIASAIARLWNDGYRDLVIVHGAGSFGHHYAKKYSFSGGVRTYDQRFGFALTHSGCAQLSSHFTSALLDLGLPAISLPPCAYVLQTSGKIVDFSDIVSEYSEHGYLPIIHGDMVPDSKLEGSVCSGDALVSHLGRFASFVAVGSDVDGVLDESGKVINLISRSNFASVSKHLRSVDFDVTGGMEGKIRQLLSIPSSSYIFNATVPERLINLVKGKKTICTEIRGSNYGR